MADDRRPRSNRPHNNGGQNRKPASGGRNSSGGQGGRPGHSGAKPTSAKPTSGGSRTGGPSNRPGGPRSSGPRQGARTGDRRGPAGRTAAERTAAQQLYDGPPIPDDVSAKDLDKFARQELSGLPDKLADKVARHLVMAGTLLHDDPHTAHKHALAARARATRTGLVREAVGETAYACGNWAEALAEFRAARRMTGRHHYAPMMADAERALGRPEKALDYDTPTTRAHLDHDGNIELSIVIAGARNDLGQHDTALQILEQEPLHTKNRTPTITRLRYAYADTLHQAGRTTEAIEWFHRVAGTDTHHTTDATQRLQQLQGEG